MARLVTVLAVSAIVCGAVLAQQQPQQEAEELPSPEGRTELPVGGSRPVVRARQRFRPRPVVRPQNRVDVVRQRRPISQVLHMPRIALYSIIFARI